MQELLISSKVLITDFSSVFFDFAYMKKPEIFFQFDNEEYRRKHYSKGYFCYENDGFGPVVSNIDNLIAELEKIIMNDGNMEDKYFERVEKFFTVNDAKNCERTFNAIKELG